jgi:hypothetical protein
VGHIEKPPHQIQFRYGFPPTNYNILKTRKNGRKIGFGQAFEMQISLFTRMDPPEGPQGLYISGWDNFKFSFLNFAVWLHVVLKYAEGQKSAGGYFDHVSI